MDHHATEGLALQLDNPPVATLAQLGLATANFGFVFAPKYCAMDDGLDCPGGVWHLFEKRPVYDPVRYCWVSDGLEWEAGGDDTDDLTDTPEFQRWVKPGFSLIEIVEANEKDPMFHPLAYMTANERAVYKVT
ncbi:hypothetical protein ISF12_11120 [Pseudomonas aeruginosa]|nr:hypothetical protein [Pseudomonas aeruginosa]